jgi:hypothetical protein
MPITWMLFRLTSENSGRLSRESSASIPGQFRLVYPRSAAGVRVLNKVVGFVASPAMQNLISKIRGSGNLPKSGFTLPDYAI